MKYEHQLKQVGVEINLGSDDLNAESLSQLDLGALKELESQQSSSNSKLSKSQKSVGNILDSLYKLGEEPSPMTGSSDTSGPLELNMVNRNQIEIEQLDLDREDDEARYQSHRGLTVVDEELSQENYDSARNPMVSNRQQFFSLGSKASD